MPDDTIDAAFIETGVDAETADAEVEVAPSDAPVVPVEGAEPVEDKDHVEVVTYDAAPLSFEGLPSH